MEHDKLAAQSRAIRHDLVRDANAMIAAMTPVLRDGRYVFCSTPDPARVAAAAPDSLSLFHEDEGTTLVMPEEQATAHGFGTEQPMARIVLEVFSALDGVGLTAAVATALAEANIPCNMIAAHHHDHVFVPDARRHEALRVLQALQRNFGDSAHI